MKQVRVEFDLPALLASQAGLDLENLSQEARRLLALFLFEHGRLSLGKACEIGGMSYWEFADLNRQLGIPFRYSENDLQDDLLRLSSV